MNRENRKDVVDGVAQLQLPKSNEQGFVLVAGLVFVAILTILGTTAYMTTTGDLQVSYNYRKSREAFYGAEAGTQEALYRLRPAAGAASISDTASPQNPNWCVYIVASSLGGTAWNPATGDPEYNASFTNTKVVSLQTTIPCWVKVRHKREYDAVQAGHTTSAPHYTDADGTPSIAGITSGSRGNIIYYGFRGTSTAHPYTKSGASNDPPVEIITSRFVE
ncbi:MAG: hypothetical protein A2521_10575 [Deltaproteobacteria bacterium RIFOXYD12_FULL_57_12]|nr:MAG: hypothetical protein A2521_10575 [Deltaproteobacteria bacterium RIFOXYD12_FULL_57_12]